MNNWNEEFNKFVGPAVKHQKQKILGDDIKEDHIDGIDSDIGRAVGFNRIAVHHFVLPPNCRTSMPHAESCEEEFVYVLSGKPHLWLDGYIHELQAGHAVGFKAGTGVAHTFINNTDADIHLLVAGEKTKKENLCSFPVNKDYQATSPIHWKDAPIRELGPHLGLPGEIKKDEWATSKSGLFVDCLNLEAGDSFHYAGNSETFGYGVRLSDKIDLTVLGIWFERLPAGKRSAFPHAHKIEEEFVYVLSGRPTVWLDGFAKQLEAGDYAAFPSGTGISHTLLNDTDDDIYYLCIGESKGKHLEEDKIYYPLHPLRNLECERQGTLWEDLPKRKLGEHSGYPLKPLNDHLYFELCRDGDEEKIFAIFEKSPTYFLRADGCLPTLKMAKAAITDGPPKRHEKYFKEFLMIYLDSKPIGILDLHAHHPEVGICYLGLLLIDEDLFSRGIGRKCFELAQDYIKRAYQCHTIRLGVSDDNDVSAYWLKMGFEPNGRNYEWQAEKKKTNVREFDKTI